MDNILNTQDNQGGTRHLESTKDNQWETETGSQGTNTHRQVHNPDISPPPGRCILAPWKQHGEGRVGTKEEAQEQDEHLGGGRQTESKRVTKEGGDRRARRRKSTA